MKGIMNKIEKYEIKNNEKIIYIKHTDMLLVFNYLKLHTELKYEQLVDITTVDYPQNENRFEVVYQLLSISKNARLRVKILTSELQPLESLVNIYPSAGWYEREIWDLYGVFFLNNPDLRRILNDYGFKGHPFRKDYPLTGYHQVRYDDEKKRIVSEPVEFAQQIRVFNYEGSWNQHQS